MANTIAKRQICLQCMAELLGKKGCTITEKAVDAHC